MNMHRIMDLLNYLACLTEENASVPWTKDRIKEIHKVVHELAHEIKKDNT